jgi:hypothetical protein
MTDIVERLRSADDELGPGFVSGIGHLAGDAADEIERLRAEVAKSQELFNSLTEQRRQAFDERDGLAALIAEAHAKATELMAADDLHQWGEHGEHFAASDIDTILSRAPQGAADLRARAMARAQQTVHPSRGALMIENERRRQTAQEGYGADHDRGHERELTEASLTYLDSLSYRWRYPDRHDYNPTRWPWGLKFWKPTIDPVRQLVKAGALIAAAIDAILAERDRASIRSSKGDES